MHDDGSFVCAHGALSPPEVELARANFVEFDVDGDGLISHQDFVAAMSRHDPNWAAPNRRAQLDAMYAAVDLDGDGQVDFIDFAVMRVRKKLAVATPRTAAWATPRPGVSGDRAMATARAEATAAQHVPAGRYPLQPPAATSNATMGLAGACRAAAWEVAAGGSAVSAMGGIASHLAGMHSARGSKTARGKGGGSGGAKGGGGGGIGGGMGGGMGGGVGGGMGGGMGAGMGGGVGGAGAVGVATPRDGPMGTPRPSYLAALVQAYYRLTPDGDGWLPSAQLAELLVVVARTCQLPLTNEQARLGLG